MFLLELCEIDRASSGGKVKPSRLAILQRILEISCSYGAGTLICKHRDLNGKITLLRLSQLAIMRQLGMKVSMVRLSDAWADWDNWSSSWITTTLKDFCCLESNYWLPATSLMSFWTITRSYISASLGLTSMWYMLLKTTAWQVVLVVELTLNSLDSLFILWTAEVPYKACSMPLVSVRLPLPEGPYSSTCGKSSLSASFCRI